MKLQKAGVNFLINSLTNATVVLDTPAPQLSSSSLLKPPRALPQNNHYVFIYLVLHNQSGKSGLDSLQCRAGFSTSALTGSTAGQKPFSICIPNWFSFPVWPDMVKQHINACRLGLGHRHEVLYDQISSQQQNYRWAPAGGDLGAQEGNEMMLPRFKHHVSTFPTISFPMGHMKLHELYPAGLLPL